MAISPNIEINELDDSQFAIQGRTGNGAIVGEFSWGPVLERHSYASIKALEDAHGQSTDETYHTSMAARNFFSYGSSSLLATRVVGSTAKNAGIGLGITAINNKSAFELLDGVNKNYSFVSRYPGSLGNKIVVDTFNFDGASQNEKLTLNIIKKLVGVNVRLYSEDINASIVIPTKVDGINFDLTQLGVNQIGNIYAHNDSFAKLVQPFDPTSTSSIQKFNDAVFYFEVIPFSVVEKFIVSMIPDNLDDNGNINYIKDVINSSSNYIYAGESVDELFEIVTTDTRNGDGSLKVFPVTSPIKTILEDDYEISESTNKYDISSGIKVSVAGVDVTDYSIDQQYGTSSFNGNASTTKFDLSADENAIIESDFAPVNVKSNVTDLTGIKLTVGGVVSTATVSNKVVVDTHTPTETTGTTIAITIANPTTFASLNDMYTAHGTATNATDLKDHVDFLVGGVSDDADVVSLIKTDANTWTITYTAVGTRVPSATEITLNIHIPKSYTLTFPTAPITGVNNIVSKVFGVAVDLTLGATVTTPAIGVAVVITISDLQPTRQSIQFTGGVDSPMTITEYTSGLDLYISTNLVDFEILLTDPAAKFSSDDCKTAVEYAVNNIVSVRKESWCSVALPLSIFTENLGNRGNMKQAIINFRNSLNIGGKSAEYAFLVNDIKQQKDPVSGKSRWVSLCADIAGLASSVSDPWISFAGYRRGILKNVDRLAFDAIDLGDRDDFVARQINPVFTQIGEGVVLLGDFTMTSKGTAFNQIGIRRLFIFLEKSVRKLSRSYLFQGNDVFTRRQYFNVVDPFFADIQARRGIVDYKIIVDDTNNTPEVITRDEFKADFKIDPTRSIRNMKMDFIATRSGQVDIQS